MLSKACGLRSVYFHCKMYEIHRIEKTFLKCDNDVKISIQIN